MTTVTDGITRVVLVARTTWWLRRTPSSTAAANRSSNLYYRSGANLYSLSRKIILFYNSIMAPIGAHFNLAWTPVPIRTGFNRSITYCFYVMFLSIQHWFQLFNNSENDMAVIRLNVLLRFLSYTLYFEHYEENLSLTARKIHQKYCGSSTRSAFLMAFPKEIYRQIFQAFDTNKIGIRLSFISTQNFSSSCNVDRKLKIHSVQLHIMLTIYPLS